MIAIKGRYSGTIQTVTQKKPLCFRMITVICPKGKFIDVPRELNNYEWELVKKTLKIKYFQDALDQLNRLN